MQPISMSRSNQSFRLLWRLVIDPVILPRRIPESSAVKPGLRREDSGAYFMYRQPQVTGANNRGRWLIRLRHPRSKLALAARLIYSHGGPLCPLCLLQNPLDNIPPTIIFDLDIIKRAPCRYAASPFWV